MNPLGTTSTDALGRVALSPTEFADELRLLLADAVWAVARDGNAEPAAELVVLLDQWRGHSLVSRAAALAVDTAWFLHRELEPLRRALVRAARFAWLDDGHQAERVRVLRWRSAVEHEDECSVVAADLLIAAVALYDEQPSQQLPQGFPPLVDLLTELLEMLYEAAADDPAYQAELTSLGARVARRLVAIHGELAESDRAQHLRSLAEAHLVAANFVSEAEGQDAGLENSERGVRLFEELADANGPTAYASLARAWSEHIDRLNEVGADREVAEWERHRVERLREFTMSAVNSAASQELSTLARLLRERGMRDEAVSVSTRAVTLAEEAAPAGEPSALIFLGEMVRLHGMDLHYLGRRAEAMASWQRFLEVLRRLRKVGADHTDSVSDGYRVLIGLVEDLDDPAAAIEFGDGAVAEWLRRSEGDPQEHLPALVQELRAQADRLHNVGRSSEGADAAERAVAHAWRLVWIDPQQFRPELCWALTSATEHHLHALHIAAADLRSRQVLGLYEELAHTDPDRYTTSLADALHNRVLALSYRNDYAQSQVLSARAVVLYKGIAAKADDHWDSLANVLCTRVGILRNLHDLDAALDCAIEAAEIYSRLAEQRPRTYLPDHAYALNQLASAHEHLGETEAAREAAARALAICDRLEEGHTRDDNRASALHALVLNLRHTGRMREALAYSTTLLDLRERLAARDPAGETAELAIALGNHALCGLDTGRPRDALRFAHRSVELLRRLSKSDSHIYRDQLASALDRYSTCLSRTHEYERALEVSAEAVEQYEELLAADRSLHLHSAAVCLNNHAVGLDKLGRNEEAVAMASRSVAMFEELVARDRRTERPFLGASLVILTGCLIELGRHEDALECAGRAISLFEELTADEFAAYATDLASALHNYATALGRLDRDEEAVPAQERAVQICETLAVDDRLSVLTLLARTTSGLGCRLANAGQWPRAREYSRAGLLLWEELVDLDPGLHLHELAKELDDHARFCGNENEWAEAATSAERASIAYEELAARDPQRHRPTWAQMVEYRAHALRKAGEQHRASAEADRALSIWRTAAVEDPAEPLPGLAAGEAWVARFRLWNGEPQRAPGHLDRAIGLYHELIDGGRADLLPELVDAHHKYAKSLCETGYRDQAAAAIEEAVRLARELVETDRAAHRSRLADVLRSQSWLSAAAGLRHAAVAAGREAVTLLEEGCDDSADDCRPDLADYHDSLADCLADVGRLAEAMEHNTQALPLWEELAAETGEPSVDVAWSLWHRARWLAALDENDRTALPLSERAVELFEQIHRDRQGDESMAGALVDHARHLARAHRYPDALNHSHRAVGMWEALAADGPRQHRPGLVDCLRWHAIHLAHTDERNAALECARRAMQLAEKAVEQSRAFCLPDLADLCRETALLLCGHDQREARAFAERSVLLYTELADAEPDIFTHRLAVARDTVGMIRPGSGP